MNKENINDKMAQVFFTHRHHISLFFKNVLNVELDDQQEEFVSSIEPGCRIMTKSCRGAGKTFVIAGLVFYFLGCFENTNMRILSPSQTQLKTVFMREVRLHYDRMDPNFQRCYDIFSDRVEFRGKPTQLAQCVTANAEKPENLSGMHATTQVYLLDEASAIDDEVYTITLGSLGTAKGLGYFIGMSNPTRSDNFYGKLFKKQMKGWDLFTLNAYRAGQIQQEWIDEQIELYGEDSDEVRVNVHGEFARSDGSMFIPMALVEESIERYIPYQLYHQEETVIGADIARSLSGDSTVFIARQGLKVLDVMDFKTEDTMETVSRLTDFFQEHSATYINMDTTGVGGPVADRCRELGLPVIDVVAAKKSTDPLQYYNCRAECWGLARDWLREGQIPHHDKLVEELANQDWGYSGKMQIQMVSKRNSRKKSPDYADAFVLTFYGKNKQRSTYRKGKRPVKKTRRLGI